MDYSHLIQGVRQFFQGHPECGPGGEKSKPVAPQQQQTQGPHHYNQNNGVWPSKPVKPVYIPPEVEARYSRSIQGHKYPPQPVPQQPQQQVVQKDKETNWGVPQRKPGQVGESPLDLSVKPTHTMPQYGQSLWLQQGHYPPDTKQNPHPGYYPSPYHHHIQPQQQQQPQQPQQHAYQVSSEAQAKHYPTYAALDKAQDYQFQQPYHPQSQHKPSPQVQQQQPQQHFYPSASSHQLLYQPQYNHQQLYSQQLQMKQQQQQQQQQHQQHHQPQQPQHQQPQQQQQLQQQKLPGQNPADHPYAPKAAVPTPLQQQQQQHPLDPYSHLTAPPKQQHTQPIPRSTPLPAPLPPPQQQQQPNTYVTSSPANPYQAAPLAPPLPQNQQHYPQQLQRPYPYLQQPQQHYQYSQFPHQQPQQHPYNNHLLHHPSAPALPAPPTPGLQQQQQQQQQHLPPKAGDIKAEPPRQQQYVTPIPYQQQQQQPQLYRAQQHAPLPPTSIPREAPPPPREMVPPLREGVAPPTREIVPPPREVVPPFPVRAPPVATVSATVRSSNTVSSSSNKPPTGRDPPVLRTTFPWLQNRNNPRVDKQQPTQQQQKPVGVALVSFKSTLSSEQQQQQQQHQQPVYKEFVKRSFDPATHPFPHLAAAAAAATAAKSMPLKFRTKAELKQMNLVQPEPLVAEKSEPVIPEEKWQEWTSSFDTEWRSFMQDLVQSENIKKVCRVSRPEPRPARNRARGRAAPTAVATAASAAAVSKPVATKPSTRVKDYDDDEDIPLSVRQKLKQQEEAKKARLLRWKRRRLSESSDNDEDDGGGGTISERIRRRHANKAGIVAENLPGRTQIPAEGRKKLKHVRCSVRMKQKKRLKRKPKRLPTVRMQSRWSGRAFRTCRRRIPPEQQALKRLRRNMLLRKRPVKKAANGTSDAIIQDGTLSDGVKLAEMKKKRLRIFRRRFKSGLDFIRKKKKVNAKENGIVRRPKAPVKSYQTLGSSLDAATEVRSWVVNKSLGETPLHRAARLGYLEGVAHLVQRPETNVSAKDNAGYTALHEACTKGHLQVARLLLQHGAQESASAKGGIRPLHEAVENDHVELVRLLLSYGADPNLATYAGQTPFALATSDPMRRLLEVHLGHISGQGNVTKWRYRGSATFMDDPSRGFDELDSSSSCWRRAGELGGGAPSHVTIQSTNFVESVSTPVFQLRSHGPQEWLRLKDVAFLLQRTQQDLMAQQQLQFVTLSRDQFTRTAAAVSPAPISLNDDESVVLVANTELVRKLLDVELDSIPF